MRFETVLKIFCQTGALHNQGGGHLCAQLHQAQDIVVYGLSSHDGFDLCGLCAAIRRQGACKLSGFHQGCEVTVVLANHQH